MTYGLKRGVKSPGEFRVTDIMGLSLAGAAGIVAALITDYQQKAEASALYTINQWVASAAEILGLGANAVPLWAVALGMIGVGAGSIFYFQPITRQGAFAQGFGLLAVLMTAVPADLAAGLTSMGDGDDLMPLEAPLEEPEQEARRGLSEGIRQASFSASGSSSSDSSGQETRARSASQERSRRSARYNVTITLDFPNGLKEDVMTMIRRGTLRGRLHNKDTGATYNLFRNAGGNLTVEGNRIVIRAGVPARSPSAQLWVRIEAEGYAIEERSTQDASLKRALNWRINMQPSQTPLFLQRLNKSYWF